MTLGKIVSHFKKDRMNDKDKTKEQLINELMDLHKRITELQTSDSKLKRAEEELGKWKHNHQHRVKELNLFYAISELVDKPDISLEQILQGTVNLIPSAWQYPESICARVIMEDQVFKTSNFVETIWKQTCKILVQDNRIGTLEVCCLEEKPESDEGPFLKEERRLINAIAERLGKIIVRKRAEKANLESEKQYHSHLENVSDVIYSIDPDYRILNVSPSVERILGYTPEELVGKHFTGLNLLTVKSLETALSDTMRVLAGERINSSEYEFIAKDGSIKIGEVSSAPLFKDNKVIAIISVARDITDRKRAEEELKNTRDFLDNVIEGSLDCIVVSDSTGHITRANKSFFKLLGYKEEEVIGKHIAEFSPTKEGIYKSTTGKLIEVDEEFFNSTKTVISRLVEEGKIYNWEGYLIRSDEKVIPVEENIDYLYNDKGDITGAVGIIRDITERKKTEEEKARIEVRLKDKVTELSIMNEISEVLLSTRKLDEILHMILIGATAYQALGFNRAFLYLINEKENTLEGKVATGSLSAEEAYKIWEGLANEDFTLKELLKSRHGELSKEDEPINKLVKQMRIALKGTESIFTQAIYEKKSFNIVNGIQNPLIDRDFINLLGTDAFALVPLISKGKPLGVLLADNFISNKPINDEDVKRLRTFANHASLAIESSHLYKSLEEKVEELSSAYNELREKRDKLIRYERLSALGKAAAGITHEIRNPLVSIGGFARRILKKDQDGEVNKNYMKIIVEEIDRLENTLTEILYFTKPAVPKFDMVELNRVIKSTFEVLRSEIEKNNINVEEHLDPNLTILWLDENQIRRVLNNLIKNAMQAMPDGGTITVSTINEHQWVRVEIADTGVGVTDEDMDKLFDAFFTSKATGSGLGLTVSAQIINNHGGTIEFQKRKPKGTIAIIKLPLKAPF
ncbi:MAG: hypothetical protein AMJ42_06415 [Deltaproteobacteria bacterium DG_8]|nr:MAG: hypothetical protein AMJ42_06415 [Deltaproteobacteria bacterium DG_8]